jgi:aryl-alcohol dehydrogenase-like predicted oxidoreductase
MARVVVTGGAGKLGRACVDELIRHGWDVVVFDRVPPPTESGAVFVPIDLTDYGQVLDAMLGWRNIDIYQVHWPDLHTPPEETAGALEELVAEGKIRHVGVSNYAVDEMHALGRFGRVETLQPPYHLFRRDIEETILPYAAAHDIGVLVYGPLAHGLLSGRMSESTTFDADDWRGKSPDFTAETFRRNLAVVERLKGFARQKDISLPQLAVAWTLANPAVHVAIVGARRPSQLDETAQAADIELSTSDLQAIDETLAGAVPVWGPHPEGM